MEAQLYLLIVVVIVFMAGAGIFGILMLSRLRDLNKTLTEVDNSLKIISSQISTEVRTELGAINRNTRWNSQI